MSQMIEMHSADHCVVVAELATSLKDVKFSKQNCLIYCTLPKAEILCGKNAHTRIYNERIDGNSYHTT